MKIAHPYLLFDGNTMEAFEFYRSVFGGDFVAVLRYRDFPDNEMGVPDASLDKIAHIGLALGEHTVLMGTDHEGSGMKLRMGNNVLITVEPDTGDEARRLFDALAEGGTTRMPLQRTGWAELHGSCTDRFGIEWMVDYTGDAMERAEG